MADRELEATVGRLSRQTADTRSKLQRDGAPGQNERSLVGYRFQPGQRVIDLATGGRVTVQSGRRSEATGRAVYVVKTAGGDLTHRDEIEIADDQAPAPQPGEPR
jgi:hypothetical protein